MRLSNFLSKNAIWVAAFLGVVIFLGGIFGIRGFGSMLTIRAILVLAAFLAIASIGQTFTMLLGGIDLSIPYMIGLGNVVLAKLIGDKFPFWYAILVILVLGILVGVVNGTLIAFFELPALIVTFGTGFIIYGSIQLWTKGFPTGRAPQFITKFVSIGSRFGPFPLPGIVLAFLVAIVLVVFTLRKTVYGRQLYALGSSSAAAKLALVKSGKIWIITYILSGLCAAIAGIFLLGFTGSAMADVGVPYSFQTVGAVVLGGTSIMGGRGSYLGTVVGSIVLVELATVLVGLGLSNALIQVCTGGIIIAMVSIYGREVHVRERV